MQGDAPLAQEQDTQSEVSPLPSRPNTAVLEMDEEHLEAIRTGVETIYRKVNPDFLPKLPALFAAHRGREDVLLLKVEKKYKAELEAHARAEQDGGDDNSLAGNDDVTVASMDTVEKSFQSVTDPGEIRELRAAITHIYEHCNPSFAESGMLEPLLEKWSGREDQLFVKVSKKYRTQIDEQKEAIAQAAEAALRTQEHAAREAEKSAALAASLAAADAEDEEQRAQRRRQASAKRDQADSERALTDGLGSVSGARGSEESPSKRHPDKVERLDSDDFTIKSVEQVMLGTHHGNHTSIHKHSTKKVHINVHTATTHDSKGNTITALAMDIEEENEAPPPVGLTQRIGSFLMRSPSMKRPPDAQEKDSPPSPGSTMLRSFSRRFFSGGAVDSNEDSTRSGSGKGSLRSISFTALHEKEEEAATSASPSKRKVPGRGWKSLRSKVSLVGRAALEADLRDQIEDPDLNVVMHLAHQLIDSPHHSSAAAYAGALLMEWAVFRGFELNLHEQRMLGRAHAEVWISRGMAGEQFNLERAKMYYEACIFARQSQGNDDEDDASLWVEYSRVLSYFGDRELSVQILKQVIANFDDDPDLSSHLLCLGAALKAVGRHDEASTYFFEAAMTGPPRFFNKLQMMFIISRNIEEESKYSDTPSEDAYLMVFQHLVMEGLVSESLSYDEWIADSNTWRELGDKCALHGAHSLACDLYGQGLMKDLQAFKKPKLWFGFAKACKRCGRTSDAQLSVKQALTMEPFNQQLLRAMEMCSTTTHDFEQLVEGELDSILAVLPPQKMSGVAGALKLQAKFRGTTERRGLRLGMGKRGDINRRMSARVGILLGGEHPVLVSAKSSWIGSVSELVVTDVSGHIARLKLKNPFTPIKETGTPRKLALTLESWPDELYDRHVLLMRFTDQETGEYLQRTLTLSFREHDTEGRLIHAVHRAGQREDEENDGGKAEHHEGKTWSLFESLRFKDDHDIRTNIVDAEVERGCFLHHQVCYFYHVYHQEHNTHVKIFQPRSDRQIVFEMQREHIDRNYELRRAVVHLMDIVHAYPRLEGILHGRKRNLGQGELDGDAEGNWAPKYHDPEGLWHNTHGNREGVIYGKALVLVRIMPEVAGETHVRLFEANACPLLGHAIEVVEPDALTQDLPSRGKRIARQTAAAAIYRKHDPADKRGLFLAPVTNIVTVESSTPRDDQQGQTSPEPGSPSSLAAASDTAVGTEEEGEEGVSAFYDASLTEEESVIAEALLEDQRELNADAGSVASVASSLSKDAGSDGPGASPGLSSKGGLRRVRVSGEDDEQDNSRGATPGGSVHFEDSVGSLSLDADAEAASVEHETPLAKKQRKRRETKEKEKDDPDSPSPSKLTKALSDGDHPAEKEKPVKRALQPMRARTVGTKAHADDNKPTSERPAPGRAKKTDPEMAEKAKKQKEEQKRAKELAAKQAVAYMMHQSAVNDAKEYILSRSREAMWRLGTEEARVYLLDRARVAKVKMVDMMAAEAAAEAAELMARKKREEEEAMEAVKAAAARVKEVTRGSIRGSIKVGGKKPSKGGRDSLREKGKGRDGDTTTQGLSTESADVGEDTHPDDGGEGEGEGEEQGQGQEGAADDAALVSSDQQQQDTRTEEQKASDQEAAAAASIETELSGSVEKPKRARLTIPKAREGPVRQPKKIAINHPPALTSKQKQAMRRQWQPADMPAWAFDSPQALVAALQGFYVPAPAVPAPAPAPPADADGAAAGEAVLAPSPLFADLSAPPLPAPAPAQTGARTGTDGDAPPGPESESEFQEQEMKQEQAGGGPESELPSAAADSGAGAGAGTGAVAQEGQQAPVTQFIGPDKAQAQAQAQAPTLPAHVPPHLVALLDPSRAASLGLALGSGGAGPVRGTQRHLSRLSAADVAQISTPLPINSSVCASAFRPTGLFDLSVAVDKKMEAFKRQKQREQQQRLLQQRQRANLDQRPVFLVGGAAQAAASASALAGGAQGAAVPGIGATFKPTLQHSASPFGPVRQVSPLAFLDADGQVNSFDAGQASMESFDARGYTDGASPYSSLWRVKLVRCLELFPDAFALKKSLAAVQRGCPLRVSKLEAFCALADTGGSATEAIGRLGDVEAWREIQMVCAMLPVASILSKHAGSALGGAPPSLSLSLYSSQAPAPGQGQSAGSVAAESSVAMSSPGTGRPTPRPFRSLSESPHIRDVRGTLTKTPTLNEATLEANGGVSLAPLGSDNLATGSPSEVRIAGLDSRKMLPHLDMVQSSSIVKSRGTTIRITGKPEVRVQPHMSPLSAAGMGFGAHFSSSGLGLGLGLGSEDAGAGQQAGLGLQIGEASLLEGSSSVVSSLSPISLQRKQLAFMSVDSDNRVAPVVPYTKSLRVSNAIDALYEQAPASMVVMCRRDAMRAAGEEVLARSPHKKLRETAQKRAKAFEIYAAKLQAHSDAE